MLAFLVIVLIPTSRPRFSLPLLVPASVLLGMAVVEMRGVKKESVKRWWRRVCLGGVALFPIGAAAVLYLVWPRSAVLALVESAFLAGGARWSSFGR